MLQVADELLGGACAGFSGASTTRIHVEPYLTHCTDLPSANPQRATFKRNNRSVAFAVMFVVAGCTIDAIPGNTPPPGYVADRWARVAAADWSQTESVNIALHDSYCQPEKLDFSHDKAYHLHFENRSGKAQFFRSEGFFKAIAIKKLRPRWRTANTSSLTRLDFAPGEQKNLDFVAVKAGIYEFHCAALQHDVAVKQIIIH